MQRMGLTRAELKTYHRALAGDHARRVRVNVLNLEGDTLTHIDPVILDGQIVVEYVEGTALDEDRVSRTLTMTFLDPDHRLNFDSESPGDGALYADRKLRVYYSIRVDDLGRWVTTVPFTGPVVSFRRSGAVVDVTAHSEERLALGDLWEPLTIKKGTKKVDAIRLIMERTGEKRFELPSLASRLPKTRSLDRFASPWSHAQRIARSLDRQLFYDGRGRLILRKLPGTPVFTFNTGRGGEVLGDATVSHSLGNFANLVLVIGAKPKGAKQRVRAQAVAPRQHPLSPWRLGRNDRPRYVVERIDDDTVRSEKEAQQRAERILEDRLRSVVDVQFDSLPIPHLDPGDLCRLKTSEGTVTFRLRTFSIPLGTDGDPVMPVGYIKRTKAPTRRSLR